MMTKVVLNAETFSRIRTSVDEADLSRRRESIRSSEKNQLYVNYDKVSTTDVKATFGHTKSLEERKEKQDAAKNVIAKAITAEYGPTVAARVMGRTDLRRQEAIYTNDMGHIQRSIDEVRGSELLKSIKHGELKQPILDFVTLREVLRQYPEIATKDDFAAGQDEKAQDLIAGAYVIEELDAVLGVDGAEVQPAWLTPIGGILEQQLRLKGEEPHEKANYSDEVKGELHHVMSLLSQLIFTPTGRARTASVSVDLDSPDVSLGRVWKAYQARMQEVCDTELHKHPVQLTWHNPPKWIPVIDTIAPLPDAPQTGP